MRGTPRANQNDPGKSAELPFAALAPGAVARFKSLTRQNPILRNPASEIDLPRVGRTLPKNILSVEEVEQVPPSPAGGAA